MGKMDIANTVADTLNQIENNFTGGSMHSDLSRILINTHLAPVDVIKVYAEDEEVGKRNPEFTCEKDKIDNSWPLNEKDAKEGFTYFLERNGEKYKLYYKAKGYFKQKILVYGDHCEVGEVEFDHKRGDLDNETGNNIIVAKFDWKNGDEINSNLKIVGFNYEVNNNYSSDKSITKEWLGKKTLDKKEIAQGSNWSDEYKAGYGHSFAHLGDKGPFYSIVGGYTYYHNETSTDVPRKDEEWGIKTNNDVYCIWSGYCWNKFLNNGNGGKGYSYTYVYLIDQKEIGNIVGGRIQITKKDSTGPKSEIISYGKKEGKEINWGAAYGWNESNKGEGYIYFSTYLEDNIDLHQKQEQALQAQIEIPPK